MSPIEQDRAIVLHTYPYGESSLVVVLLTRQHGKVRLLAKGARGARSAFAGSLQLGNACEVVYSHRETRGLQLLREAEGCGAAAGEGADFERLCLIQAGLEIIDRSVVETEVDERAFDALASFMLALREGADAWAAFFTLEVAVLKMVGSFPATHECGSCGRPREAGTSFGLDAARGTVCCGTCAGRSRRIVSAEASAKLDAMERGGEAARAVRLDSAERREIGEMLHRLFASHVEGYRLPNSLGLLRGGTRK